MSPRTNIIPETPNPDCVLIKFHKKFRGIGIPCNSCTNNQLRKEHGCPILSGATLAEIYQSTFEKSIKESLKKVIKKEC